MAKKIKSSDIAEKDLFGELQKDAVAFGAALSGLEKTFKDILAVQKEIVSAPSFANAKDINAVVEAINNTKTATEGLNKIEQQRKKLEAELKDLNEGKLKANFELQEQLKDRRKALREEAKESAKLLTTYQKQSKELNDLRKRYKNVALEQGKGSKEAKKLRKELQRLDETLKEVDADAGQFQRSVGNYSDAISAASSAIGSLSGNLAANAVSGAFDQLIGAFTKTSEGASILGKVTGGISLSFSALLDSGEAAKKFLKGDFSGALDEIAEKFKVLTGAIGDNNEAVDEQIKNLRELGNLEVQVARLTKEQERLQSIADDSTISLKAQLEANEQVFAVSEDIAKREIVIASRRLSQINKVAAAEEKAGQVSVDTINAQNEARIALIDAEGEIVQVTLDTARRRQEIRRDAAEQELDILIDAFDNQKTVNERILANEKITVEARQELLKQTAVLANESAEEQIAVIEKLKGITIDANDLIGESDTKVLNEKIKLLELDEITQTRLLEVIRERRTVVQDLNEEEIDLNETKQDTIDIQNDIELQLSTLAALQKSGAVGSEVLASLEEKRNDQLIADLERRIALQKELTSPEAAALQQQLLDAQIEKAATANEKQLQKEADDNEKRLEQQQDFQDAALEATKAFLEKQSNEKLSAINKELNAVQDRQKTLEALARNGSENAEKNLATEQRREAELQRAKEQQIKRQARQELVLSALGTYTAKVESGDTNALSSTITDIALLTEFVNSLPTFWAGSENVAGSLGAPDMAGQDGYIVRVDGGERVVPTSINNDLGGVSNDMLPTLVHEGLESRKGGNNNALISEIRSLKSAIIDKPTYTGSDFDTMTKILTLKYVKGNGTENVKRKLR